MSDQNPTNNGQGGRPLRLYAPPGTDVCRGVSDIARDLVRSPSMLVFDYAPKLRIAGAYHSLNNDDRAILSRFVDESDFVALETDNHRMNGTLKLTVGQGRKKYQRGDNSLCVTRLDTFYLRALLRLQSRYNKFVVSEYNSMLADECESRTGEEDEFWFCDRLAREKGKDVYYVDDVLGLWAEIIKLDAITKVRYLQFLLRMCDEPNCVKKIIEDMREIDMLSEIERLEGKPIEQLERGGLLVTGKTHAMNYLHSLRERVDEIIIEPM